MALATADLFASFDITDGSQIRDISPLLAEALYLDLNALGNVNVDFSDPVEDIIYYWNEDALNPDTVTMSASALSTATSLGLTVGHGARVHTGDLLSDTRINSTEILQVTAGASDTPTVVRAYNSTTAATIASNAVLAVIRAEQEGSDIGSDKSLAPVVRSNYTQIFAGAFDLKITGSQLARKMATDALRDQVAHQLANRLIEFKLNLTRGLFYSEKAGPGSDTQYRSFGGVRYWNRVGSGISNSSSEAVAMAVLNLHNKSAVDKGVYVDTMYIGTDLVNSVNAIDATNRRMLESENEVGYRVTQLQLGQGNWVTVVVDGRIQTGDAFLVKKDNIRLRPMIGRGMFTIAAVDFADAKKRRVLGEWGCEVRNPEATIALFNKT
jgi:hypothetical protein